MIKETRLSITSVLAEAIKLEASDIHITNGVRPVFRINGHLVQWEDHPICTPELLASYRSQLLTETMLKEYGKHKYIDTATNFEDSRFRVHIYRQRDCDAFSLRLIPTEIPRYSDLNLPKIIRRFTGLSSGLVLVCGVTGSGKSTTLASMIDDINANQTKHIITIEDPIEFLHSHKMSIVNQREIGRDVNSFPDAVRAAMREDPDILLVGELRDLETISNAITMAETGHLVFATLHTKSAAETVDRLVDVYPASQQEQVKIQLSNSLQGIVTQDLLQKIGGGRVPCCEVLIMTDAIRNLIRDNASPNAINDALQTGYKRIGTQTKALSASLLVKEGLITKETAYAAVGESDRENLEGMLLR